MTTYNKCICLFVVVFQITVSIGSYYISTSRRATYEDKQCRLAVPEIISYSIKEEAYLITNDIQDNIPSNGDRETLWIGYYKSEMAFEYIGCVKESDIPGDQSPSKINIDGNLGECYKSCQSSKVIGVTIEKCYCFDASPDSWNKPLLESSCNNVCNKPDSVACGGINNDESYVSLYRINSNVTERIPTDSKKHGSTKKCLEFNPSKSDLKWKRCDEKKRIMCRDGEIIADPERKGWLGAALLCFTYNKYPISYSNALTIRGNSHSVWTGVFKLDIIYKQGDAHGMIDNSWHGYLTKDHGNYFLHFTNKNENMKVLCETETTVSTTPRENHRTETTLPTPDTETTETTTSRENQHTQTTQPTPDTESMKTTTSRENKHIQTTLKTPDTDTGTAAIVSITAMLVTIVAVVIVVLVHRRCKYSKGFGKMTETSTTVNGSEYNYPEFAYNNTTLESTTQGDVNYNYPDFSVQDARNTGGMGIESETYESTYSVTQDSNTGGLYNKTNNGTNSYSNTRADDNWNCNDEQTNHVYNKLENDEAYNVPGKQQKMVPGKHYAQAAPVQKSGTGASYDITYDLSMSSDVKLKKTPDFTDNVYNTENETYNRLGDEAANPSKTDNLYGTKQMEKFKHILRSAYDDNDQSYNSTSKNCEKSDVTDNPYSKLDSH